MTLVEVMVALSVMVIVLVGVLATFIQSRRLTAATLAQNCALTIVQGYVEQLKNLPLKDFVNASPTDPQDNPNITTSFTLPTIKDQESAASSDIELTTTPSTVDSSLLLNATPGTTPTGAVDNLQSFKLDVDNAAGTTTWKAAWPNAKTFPSTTPGTNDLLMNFWVQITDLTPSSSAKCKAYGVLIVYTWQFKDGVRVHYVSGSVRTIRSAIQTF